MKYGAILELAPKGNLSIYYLDCIREIFTYKNNYKIAHTNSTVLASKGFPKIWICYLGVNLLGIVLPNNYGSFTLTYNSIQESL